jgi:hypothetical protein
VKRFRRVAASGWQRIGNIRRPRRYVFEYSRARYSSFAFLRSPPLIHLMRVPRSRRELGSIRLPLSSCFASPEPGELIRQTRADTPGRSQPSEVAYVAPLSHAIQAKPPRGLTTMLPTFDVILSSA